MISIGSDVDNSFQVTDVYLLTDLCTKLIDVYVW
jgi:hypothetical protein